MRNEFITIWLSGSASASADDNSGLRNVGVGEKLCMFEGTASFLCVHSGQEWAYINRQPFKIGSTKTTYPKGILVSLCF